MQNIVRTITIAVVAALLFGCQGKQAATATGAGPPAGANEETFATTDGWTIHGDYYPAPNAKKSVMLLHMRGGSAADWSPLIPKLTAEGIAVLAIDQRGAGRSKGLQNGDDAPWDTHLDIEAAVKFLEEKRIPAGHIGIAGASYGANNALIFASSGAPKIPAVALLSPGTDYHGLKIQAAARAYKGSILVLTASGDGITGGGPDLITRTVPSAKTVTYGGDAHGTSLFVSNTEAVGAIVEFFKAKL